MATNRWTAADLPDLTGRTAVVTGASSGLGVATAAELARAGATVVLAVRDPHKGRAAAKALPGSTEVRALDLASLASVRAFADGWTGDLDILVNNAGIMQVPQGRTVDGFELHLGTNHLGPFALTNLLLPHIRQRIVTVSSQLHTSGRVHLDDRQGDKRRYNALQAYRDSKLANTLFTLELARRLREAGSAVRAVTAHPGIAKTNLTAHVGGPVGRIQALMRPLFNDAERGALPTLYAATADIPSGSYVGPDGFQHLRGYPQIHQPGKAATDAETARRLWARSAELTGTDIPFSAVVERARAPHDHLGSPAGSNRPGTSLNCWHAPRLRA